MSHPYVGIPGYRFWSRAVAMPAAGHVDPMTIALKIGATEKISTMGSCFAQHLAKNISKVGFNYFIAETPPLGMGFSDCLDNNYGIFSARYGNVYTAKQAVQLFDRAFGNFQPQEDIWRRGNVFVDPFRPQIAKGGFATEDSLRKDRAGHLYCVRRVFGESDWLILTLGLTEAWRSRRDEAVFPVAPGVAGGEFSTEAHEFVNFRAGEVLEDLRGLINRIRSINPSIKFIITVSPVPLVATYEDRHVLVSTFASKAALRVAADEVISEFNDVFYFPSYEIIKSPASGGRYFEDDLRQVTELGVSHVMRIFGHHFLDGSIEGKTDGIRSNLPLPTNDSAVVCDEELIERAVRLAGF